MRRRADTARDRTARADLGEDLLRVAHHVEAVDHTGGEMTPAPPPGLRGNGYEAAMAALKEFCVAWERTHTGGQHPIEVLEGKAHRFRRAVNHHPHPHRVHRPPGAQAGRLNIGI